MDSQRMTPIQRWLYAGACVLLPVLWGLVMVWVTSRFEHIVSRRRLRARGPREVPPEETTLEYHI